MADRPGGEQPGKRVVLAALRQRELRKPGEDTHPKLRALYRDAASVPVTWRELYKLPPSDPRFLAMTAEDMADDLLQHRYHELRIFYADNPGAEAQHDEAQARQLAEMEAALAADTEWHDQLRRVAAESRRESDPLAPHGGFAMLPTDDEDGDL